MGAAALQTAGEDDTLVAGTGLSVEIRGESRSTEMAESQEPEPGCWVWVWAVHLTLVPHEGSLFTSLCPRFFTQIEDDQEVPH